MRVNREALAALHEKYVTMLAMRFAHEAGGEDAVEVRAQMAELALRFPGALREMDDLELCEIRRRVEALRVAVHGEGEVEPWMEAIALFHALARGAICAKRWLGGRKRLSASLEHAWSIAVADLDFPDEARAWTGELAAIASPPRGRVMDLVFARLARQLGTTEREARRLVFGLSRRERQLV